MAPTPQQFCADCHTDLHARLPDTRLGDAVAISATVHPEFQPRAGRTGTASQPQLQRVSLDAASARDEQPQIPARAPPRSARRRRADGATLGKPARLRRAARMRATATRRRRTARASSRSTWSAIAACATASPSTRSAATVPHAAPRRHRRRCSADPRRSIAPAGRSAGRAQPARARGPATYAIRAAVQFGRALAGSAAAPIGRAIVVPTAAPASNATVASRAGRLAYGVIARSPSSPATCPRLVRPSPHRHAAEPARSAAMRAKRVETARPTCCCPASQAAATAMAASDTQEAGPLDLRDVPRLSPATRARRRLLSWRQCGSGSERAGRLGGIRRTGESAGAIEGCWSRRSPISTSVSIRADPDELNRQRFRATASARDRRPQPARLAARSPATSPTMATTRKAITLHGAARRPARSRSGR